MNIVRVPFLCSATASAQSSYLDEVSLEGLLLLFQFIKIDEESLD